MPLPETGNTKAFSLVLASSGLIIAMIAAMVFLTAAPGAVRASESDWIGDPQIGEARLVSAVRATGDLDRVPLGIEFTLTAGWKIYTGAPRVRPGSRRSSTYRQARTPILPAISAGHCHSALMLSALTISVMPMR